MLLLFFPVMWAKNIYYLVDFQNRIIFLFTWVYQLLPMSFDKGLSIIEPQHSLLREQPSISYIHLSSSAWCACPGRKVVFRPAVWYQGCHYAEIWTAIIPTALITTKIRRVVTPTAIISIIILHRYFPFFKSVPSYLVEPYLHIFWASSPLFLGPFNPIV
jgi:hypothetical protein